jgi:hypothetical protein
MSSRNAFESHFLKSACVRSKSVAEDGTVNVARTCPGRDSWQASNVMKFSRVRCAARLDILISLARDSDKFWCGPKQSNMLRLPQLKLSRCMGLRPMSRCELDLDLKSPHSPTLKHQSIHWHASVQARPKALLMSRTFLGLRSTLLTCRSHDSAQRARHSPRIEELTMLKDGLSRPDHRITTAQPQQPASLVPRRWPPPQRALVQTAAAERPRSGCSSLDRRFSPLESRRPLPHGQ